VSVSSVIVDEIKRIIKSSEITKEDDAKWPQKNKDGRQELEIRLGSDHISFEVCDEHSFLKSNRSLIKSYLDGEDWFIGRCYRISGSRGTACVLLPRARPESSCLQPDCTAF
jgi:hypothetical protein